MSLFAIFDPAVLAALHHQAFDDAWDEAAFGQLLASPGVSAIAAGEADAVDGFVLCRTVAGEAEVLTIAVAPRHRGRGLGHALLRAAIEEALRLGAETMFLEVAADNGPALSVYRSAGFRQIGLRKGYYAPNGVDALVMRRDLNRSPAADYVSGEPRSD